MTFKFLFLFCVSLDFYSFFTIIVAKVFLNVIFMAYNAVSTNNYFS